jgi:L-ascorbate metabolism protein UlaG (beta-lactamase superfamily)
LKLRWLLTAAFEILSEKYKFLIDPWISRPSDAIPQLKTKLNELRNFDAIFLTHGHFDHSFDVPEIVKNTDTKVFCSSQVINFFINKFGVDDKNLEEIKPSLIIDFPPDLKVKVIKSQHIQFDEFVMKRVKRLRSANLPESFTRDFAELNQHIMGDVFGFLMEFSNGKKLVHFGSGGYFEEELRKLPSDIDIFLAPVAGRGDADRVIAEMANIFKPKMIIPHHYDDFFPPITWNAYSNLDQEVKRLNPKIIVNKLEYETYYEI